MLQCPRAVCQKLREAARSTLVKGVAWTQLKCPCCLRSSSAAKWLCPCGIPWHICKDHRSPGFACGTRPRFRAKGKVRGNRRPIAALGQPSLNLASFSPFSRRSARPKPMAKQRVGSGAHTAVLSAPFTSSGTLPFEGSGLVSHDVHIGTHEVTGPQVKKRRLGNFTLSGLPKPAPRNAARDAISPAVVANPDPTAGSSSRNAAPLQDMPLQPHVKSSPEVHQLEDAAADSITMPLLSLATDGHLEQHAIFATPAGFTISSNPQPAGSASSPPSSSMVTSCSALSGEVRHSKQVLSKRPAFVLGPKLSKRFRAEGS